MLPSNLVYRTFFIRAEQYGTAFTIDVGDKQFLVTARHLISSTGDQIELQILHSRQWHKGRVRVVGRGKGDLDIAVLQAPKRLTAKEFEVTLSMGEIVLGQDVFFLGFPYKLWTDYGDLLGGLPGPYLKKGALSAVTMESPQTLYVDAINNEGFSGGPLYFFKNGNMKEVCIAGIVSKYRTEHEPVIDQNGGRTGLSVEYNTGFMVAYGIKHALEIIAAAGEA